ncbi:hypothetical protein [Sporosarcina saromensis]|uniref:hypothetical protein n=1 Tax=Sporosarcina saromensis TaxID=359365 RepID=UPI00295F5037|nr:hypothetical protein [Sporosarcina saromensis]
MIPNIKYELSDNNMLKEAYSITLDKTPAVKGKRAWTEREYNAMQGGFRGMAEKAGRGARTASDVHDVMENKI